MPHKIHAPFAALFLLALGGIICLRMPVPVCASSGSNSLRWMGYDWNMTNGGYAGVLQASQNNISVDANGYLHLRISKSSDTFTGSELFTRDNFGFGTFQWQIQGSNIYAMDPPVVLGLFPYGPRNGIGVDAENELDIEFSNWNGEDGEINADFTDYPSTGNKLPGGKSAWEDNFKASSSPANTTARIQWSSTSAIFTLMGGLQPIGTTANIIKQETFKGNNVTIPQAAIPVGMNLWSFKAKPAHSWEIVIRSFQYQAQSA